PYQFKLLQQVFNQIRKHGASGKHLSEGERSMLSAFQDAAKKFTNEEQGVLIPFYAFYDSVHEFLDGSIQRVITRAIDGANKGDGLEPFDVDVLKLLFLIRYTGDIPANVDNIATLMVSSINVDKLGLKTLIKDSLHRLISQNYVQKNADDYRFLTDDEQDINREIENTVLDEILVVEAIGKYIFGDIYEDQKYKYNNRYNFAFNSKIDEKGIGNQTAKIGIRFLTKASDDYDADEAALKMASADKNDLIIRLDGNSEYFEEMKQALKIERFDKTKKADKMPDAYNRIIIEKQEEAQVRRNRAKKMLEEEVTKARYYVNGERFESHGSNAKERINNAMKVLVEGVYNRLPYIVEFLENDDDIRKILQAKDEQLTLDGSSSDQNYLATQEIISFIELQNARHLQITMKNILDKFETEPYGWREIDIAGLVAGLFKKQQIRLLYKGSYLESTEKALVSYLRKKTEIENLVVKKRVGIDPQLIKVARDICKELFDTIDVPADEDGIVKKLLEKMQEKSLFIHEEYLSQYKGKNYPGKEIIEKGLSIFKELEKCKADNLTLLTKLKEEQKALLDWDEEMLSVQAFFKNQRPIFDKGLEIIAKIDDNSSYLQVKEFIDKTTQLREITDDPAPFNRIIEMPDLTSWLKERFETLLAEKKNSSEAKIVNDQIALQLSLNQYNLSDQRRIDYKKEIDDWYESKIEDLHISDNFIKLDAAITQSTTFREKIMEEIKKEIRPTGGGRVRENFCHQLNFNDFKVDEFDELRTAEDVEKYMNKLSTKLKGIINENKIIRFQ
ncbi:MAG: BREX system P-loop protein BrxC, partial [Fibrobacter sp.]|nr:BREX system P-loop protein BrxC [Fibrobacter sp.]